MNTQVKKHIAILKYNFAAYNLKANKYNLSIQLVYMYFFIALHDVFEDEHAQYFCLPGRFNDYSYNPPRDEEHGGSVAEDREVREDDESYGGKDDKDMDYSPMADAKDDESYGGEDDKDMDYSPMADANDK